MRERSPARKGIERLPVANGGISRLAYKHARAAGIDPEAQLQEAGLTRGQIENPRAPIKVRDQIKFLNLVASTLDDDFLGFRLAQACDLREIGLLYYVLASSEILIDALQRAVRYSTIVNEGVSQRCIDGKNIGLSFDYVGVSRHPDRHQIEFWITALVRTCRQLTGFRVVPERVRLVHHRTAGHELAEIFGENIEFGAPVDDIVFPVSIRNSRVVSADPYLNNLLISYCEEALAHRNRKRGSFQSVVENAIAPLLPHGKATTADVARHLGLSRRTFARRLSSEGLTFSELLENLRSDLASRYLVEGDMGVSEVAWLLGYREVGSFSHAFRRWTGKRPREVLRAERSRQP
ncbi:MAG TPA: AraC family transcriptional regulator ligand-binding domain-containing protein [Pseudolabrys sp.]|nr:AraC family transcriptional regulator ligand-binding domain-containing protein [Pseudolabrys sp.]